MASKNNKKLSFTASWCLYGLWLILFLFSCKTTPVLDTTVMKTLPLEKGGSVYIIANAKQARAKYEEIDGPVTGFRCIANNGWSWINEPWPWKEEFNFKFVGEEHI